MLAIFLCLTTTKEYLLITLVIQIGPIQNALLPHKIEGSIGSTTMLFSNLWFLLLVIRVVGSECSSCGISSNLSLAISYQLSINFLAFKFIRGAWKCLTRPLTLTCEFLNMQLKSFFYNCFNVINQCPDLTKFELVSWEIERA